MQESPPVVARHHLSVVGAEGPRTDAIALDGNHDVGTFVIHEVPWPPSVAAPCPCRFANMRGHHDRLVRAATDVAMTLDLLELAVTWNELDYSREPLIPPADWLDFVGEHRWPDLTVAERLFTAAVDVALRRPPALVRADAPPALMHPRRDVPVLSDTDLSYSAATVVGEASNAIREEHPHQRQGPDDNVRRELPDG